MSNRKYNNNDKRSTKSNRNTRKPGDKIQTSGKRTKSDGACTTGSGGTDYSAIHSNDISWWNKSAIYKDATSIQRNRFSGYTYYPYDTITASPRDCDPSVLSIRYSPVIGVATDHQSPVNRSFTSLYAEIVAHTNSSNLGFTKASLAMLSMAATSAICMIAEAERAYGLRNIYFNVNANFPRVLYSACGFDDYDTVNWEYIRAKLNTLIADFNSLMIPDYISLFQRAWQLPYNVYSDEDGLEGHFTIFVPDTYYVYKDTENKAVAVNRNYHTLPVLLDCLDAVLSGLRSTSDLGLIMGAYRRAFPESKAISFPFLDANFTVLPHYDRNMTWQVNNMSRIAKEAIDLDSLSVTEDVVQDLILCQPVISAPTDESIFNFMCFVPTTQRSDTDGSTYWDDIENRTIRLNSYDGLMDDEFYMEATRLIVVPATQSTGAGLPVAACGTEIVHSASVLFYSYNDDGELNIQSYPINTVFANGLTTTISMVEQMDLLTKFRNHFPVMYKRAMVNPSNTISYWSYVDFRDYYKTTEISASQLTQLHSAAMQSCYLVNIPTTW